MTRTVLAIDPGYAKRGEGPEHIGEPLQPMVDRACQVICNEGISVDEKLSAKVHRLEQEMDGYKDALATIADYRSYALEAGRSIDDKDVAELERIAEEALKP